MREILSTEPSNSHFEQILALDTKDLAAALENIFNRINNWVELNFGTLHELARRANQHVLFDTAGWLPHYTTPFTLITDNTDVDDLSALLNVYYCQNWTHVRAEFEARLFMLEVDDDAKATFSEALDVHGHGLYRATPRLLFPEIERIARAELPNGGVGGMASLKELREAAGHLGLSELAPKGGGPVFAQFARMANHIYEHVSTPEQVADLANDYVPNRHAVIHGLVTYRTMQSSLNALIMTEFMYQVIHAMKANARGKNKSLLMTSSKADDYR